MSIIVPGHGPTDPLGIIIGEAPGAEEAEAGVPFVGASGKALDILLKQAGGRREDFYVTNVVKEYREGNPTPTHAEIDAVRPELREEVLALSPVPILLLGNVALYAALKRKGISKERGVWRRRCLPTFHPAATMYDDTKLPAFERDVTEFVQACWNFEAGKPIPGLSPTWDPIPDARPISG